MKLGSVIVTNDAEAAWNAFRPGVFALRKGDMVQAFLPSCSPFEGMESTIATRPCGSEHGGKQGAEYSPEDAPRLLAGGRGRQAAHKQQEETPDDPEITL